MIHLFTKVKTLSGSVAPEPNKWCYCPPRHQQPSSGMYDDMSIGIFIHSFARIISVILKEFFKRMNTDID